MSLLAWIIVGAVAGLVASTLVDRTVRAFVRNVGLGIGGALAGGALLQGFEAVGMAGVDLYSLVGAAVGAVVVLLIYGIVVRRRRPA